MQPDRGAPGSRRESSPSARSTIQAQLGQLRSPSSLRSPSITGLDPLNRREPNLGPAWLRLLGPSFPDDC
jgi:hypothetical protein